MVCDREFVFYLEAEPGQHPVQRKVASDIEQIVNRLATIL